METGRANDMKDPYFVPGSRPLHFFLPLSHETGVGKMLYKIHEVSMKQIIRRAVRAFGFEVHRSDRTPFREANPDVTDLEWGIWEATKPYSMASETRAIALIRAVEHIVKCQIEGDFVECGVWRGGSSMTMALSLLEFGDRSRDLFLYDTFEGMTQPTHHDVDYAGTSAESQLQTTIPVVLEANVWASAPLDEVARNLASTGYPIEKIHFIPGAVEETIPGVAPEKIAILRLDTDWYESTLHELRYLFPKVVPGGIVIIDDYGHWKGAREAVDEYFAGEPVFLHRVDYTARLIIKS